MKRRDFLKQSLSASVVLAGAGYASLDFLTLAKRSDSPDALATAIRGEKAAAKVLKELNPLADEGVPIQPLAEANPAPFQPFSRPAQAYEQLKAEQWMASVQTSIEEVRPIEEIVLDETDLAANQAPLQEAPTSSASTVQEKVANFEENFTDDIILDAEQYQVLVKTLERINRVQDYVGFGNFNILSFDQALKYARNTPRIGEFTEQELLFMEEMFSYDSKRLGFFGEKVIDRQTFEIADRDVAKMPGTGHYVFRGHSEVFYNKLRTEVGDSLILTSGVRNIVKQYQLFLAKAVQARGNLSRASRSLAPPGHSYHAIGDFDVGQVGGGLSNFTAAFAQTDEFKRLQDLGYVKIRYTADNDYGVRYEPWHIRVV